MMADASRENRPKGSRRKITPANSEITVVRFHKEVNRATGSTELAKWSESDARLKDITDRHSTETINGRLDSGAVRRERFLRQSHTASAVKKKAAISSMTYVCSSEENAMICS